MTILNEATLQCGINYKLKANIYYVYPFFYKQMILMLIDICKLFLCNSKPIHALLAS